MQQVQQLPVHQFPAEQLNKMEIMKQVLLRPAPPGDTSAKPINAMDLSACEVAVIHPRTQQTFIKPFKIRDKAYLKSAVPSGGSLTFNDKHSLSPDTQRGRRGATAAQSLQKGQRLYGFRSTAKRSMRNVLNELIALSIQRNLSHFVVF